MQKRAAVCSVSEARNKPRKETKGDRGNWFPLKVFYSIILVLMDNRIELPEDGSPFYGSFSDIFRQPQMGHLWKWVKDSSRYSDLHSSQVSRLCFSLT